MRISFIWNIKSIQRISSVTDAPMEHVFILLHIIALAAGLWSAFSIHTRSRRLRTNFFRSYFIYILLFLMVVFLRMSSRYIFANLLGDPLVKQPLFILFAALGRVLAEAGMAYFFLKSLWSLQGENIPAALQRILAGIFAIFVPFLGMELAGYVHNSGTSRLTLFNKAFDAAVLAAMLVPLVIILARKKPARPQAFPAVLSFASLYSAGFFLLPAFIWLPRPFDTVLISLDYVYLNLCPIIWLRCSFPHYREQTHPGENSEKNLRSILLRYGITERESEIIRLIMEGKSNREIENILFISHHTVRNHIHNVFEKMGVKSRGQLLYRIRQELDMRA